MRAGWWLDAELIEDICTSIEKASATVSPLRRCSRLSLEDTTHLVHAGRKTSGDVGAEDSVDGSLVESFEKGKVLRVGHGGGVELVDLLDHDMRVTCE